VLDIYKKARAKFHSVYAVLSAVAWNLF